jgi:2-hydroxychromene-2-carboxylate isomerase
MKQITFYFDVISPYAYLAFEALPQALQGISHQVHYQPVLFAALLKHHGQLGPAEIAGKRDWTYQQVQWWAHQHQIPFQLPHAHPFNPLSLLRLALASPVAGLPSRWVCETIFRHVWRDGGDPLAPDRMAALIAQLAPARDPNSPEVKQQLIQASEQALSKQLFGVPTMAVDDKLFWGFDALPMMAAFLRGDPWFETGAWEAAQRLPSGVSRK